jgi:thymidylate synthase
VGGFGRDINIFFLLVEALWIYAGRKDLKLLEFFNSRMRDFSDDGTIFHAPYGWRLRHHGVNSEEVGSNHNGYDQVEQAVQILSKDPESRQVVMSIWNPLMDLGYKSKDIPCNDLVMLKIRDGKLITTIQNRSNDLHWGLPTNIFQFSFLTEMMALCLDVELGTQTHNSQSLHIYDWNEIAKNMEEQHKQFRETRDANKYVTNMYAAANLQATEHRVDFAFDHDVIGNRFRELDIVIRKMLVMMEAVMMIILQLQIWVYQYIP